MRLPELEGLGTSVVEILMKHNANTQRTSNDGDTAAALAEAHNNADIAEMLLELSVPRKQCSVCNERKLENDYAKSNWKKTGKKEEKVKRF